MRLIDADELERKVRWYGGNTAGLLPQYELINAPTVNAIPIEWIEKKLKCCDNINAEIFVKALIRDWRKENDFATNSRMGNRGNGDNDSNISSTTNSGLYKESITR